MQGQGKIRLILDEPLQKIEGLDTPLCDRTQSSSVENSIADLKAYVAQALPEVEEKTSETKEEAEEDTSSDEESSSESEEEKHPASPARSESSSDGYVLRSSDSESSDPEDQKDPKESSSEEEDEEPSAEAEDTRDNGDKEPEEPEILPYCDRAYACILTDCARIHVYANSPLNDEFICKVSRSSTDDTPTIEEWSKEAVTFTLSDDGLRKYVVMLVREACDRSHDGVTCGIDVGLCVRDRIDCSARNPGYMCISRTTTWFKEGKSKGAKKRMLKILQDCLDMLADLREKEIGF